MKKIIYYMPGTYGSLLMYCITIATNPKCPIWPRGPIGQVHQPKEFRLLSGGGEHSETIIKHLPSHTDNSNYNATVLLSDNELNNMFFTVSLMCRSCDFDFIPERFHINLHTRIVENLQRNKTDKVKLKDKLGILSPLLATFNTNQNNPNADFNKCVTIIIGTMKLLKTRYDILKKYKKESRFVINFTNLLQPDTFLQTLQSICDYFKLEYNKESESRILNEHTISMNNNCLSYLDKDWVKNNVNDPGNPFIQAFKIDNPKYFDAS